MECSSRDQKKRYPRLVVTGILAKQKEYINSMVEILRSMKIQDLHAKTAFLTDARHIDLFEQLLRLRDLEARFEQGQICSYCSYLSLQELT
jgi:hypothetical protein